ncbi:MAG: tetratricopeptide repeat protein [Planctomycetes bacterium]|nr:tetratricopeptide repeat protein [Planctomycetota bacterium]
MSLEEISWGQRLAGFSSPEFFRENNLQGETNIHNFLTGPFGTTLKHALAYALAAALALYGLVYPVVLHRRFRLAVWLDSRGLAAPPLYLWPYFVTAALLECSSLRFNEAEVAEVLVGLGLTLMTVHYRFTRGGAKKKNREAQYDAVHESTGACGDVPAGLTLRLGIATALVLLLNAGTTTALFASPSSRARIDRRIANGVEKFAGRYARYEQWEKSLRLYERVLEKERDRASILRKLADCAKNMGDQAKSDQYLHRALAIDLKKYKKRTRSASVHRSLTRTYRAMGDEETAQKHLENALHIALGRVKKDPNSASAAYSLGRAYSLMERHGPALEELARALKLKPSSKKYRKAYHNAKKDVSWTTGGRHIRRSHSARNCTRHATL